MKLAPASLLSLFMACLLVVMQLAGSSPALHGFLHGEEPAGHACCGDANAGGGDPGPSDTDQPVHSCAVVQLDGGILSALEYAVAAVTRRCYFVSAEDGPGDLPRQFRQTPTARAPPVN